MIAILDYGLGNIKAFANIYDGLNIPFVVASTCEQVESADKIILPGVGAFDYAMDKLNLSGLRDSLDNCVLANGIPVLGICVGMQMMADNSDEGVHSGLGWISGKVRKISLPFDGGKINLPHMGWNAIKPKSNINLFNGLDSVPEFYFLHSYYYECSDKSNCIATVDYHSEISCAVSKDNIYGVQFHPEKSHHNGTTLLANFARF